MRFTKLEVLRRRAGLSQTSLGALVGCAGSYVSRVESGRSTPSASMLDRFADVLGGDPAHLLDDPFNEKDPAEAGSRELSYSTNHSEKNLDA